MDRRVHGYRRRNLRERNPAGEGCRAVEQRARRLRYAHVCARNPAAYSQRPQGRCDGGRNHGGPEALRRAGSADIEPRRANPCGRAGTRAIRGAVRMTTVEDGSTHSARLKDLAIEELKVYWVIVLYLAIFLGALTNYRR